MLELVWLVSHETVLLFSLVCSLQVIQNPRVKSPTNLRHRSVDRTSVIKRDYHSNIRRCETLNSRRVDATSFQLLMCFRPRDYLTRSGLRNVPSGDDGSSRQNTVALCLRRISISSPTGGGQNATGCGRVLRDGRGRTQTYYTVLDRG